MSHEEEKELSEAEKELVDKTLELMKAIFDVGDGVPLRMFFSAVHEVFIHLCVAEVALGNIPLVVHVHQTIISRVFENTMKAVCEGKLPEFDDANKELASVLDKVREEQKPKNTKQDAWYEAFIKELKNPKGN